MSNATFFTALAPDERIQGSRDPLGLLPIWARLGRRIIGNITTVSGDLRGWTSLLVMVGLFRDRIDTGLFDPARPEPMFRAEQMIAYSRVMYGSAAEVRGLNQIRRHLREHDNGRQGIPLGEQPERRILNAQRAAGVWGQISFPAASSRLLDRSRFQLLGDASTLWSRVIAPRLSPHSRRISDILNDKHGFEPARTDEALARVLAAIHEPTLDPEEVRLYRDQVLYGGRRPDAPQGAFVEMWRKQTDPSPRSPVDISTVGFLARRAREAGLPEVATPLEHIVAAERLLSPMEGLFSWVQSRNRQTLTDVVSELCVAWSEPIATAAMGTDEILAPPLREVYPGTEIPRMFASIRDALVAGRWSDAILGVIDLNGVTMRRRGGAPWVQIVDGKLEVRLADEQASLPSLNALHRDLVHSYYIDPLRRLMVAWEDGQHA